MGEHLPVSNQSWIRFKLDIATSKPVKRFLDFAEQRRIERTEQAGRKSKRELDVLLAHLPTSQEGQFHIFTETVLDDRVR